ncbi:hypothetical protein M8C21_029826 [Ambrosia artemisiifolia]|uniref:Malectin-like domain-containing protein n=1 Tax=Ambrosia artemisiifolia TaxID=4212 RepID=A0AAD5GAG2_AMBAR|nr:hypothetical protein M8C21_029826 [Ambrosia artemisiifolia]
MGGQLLLHFTPVSWELKANTRQEANPSINAQAQAEDSDIDVCLYSKATDPPVIGSIKVIRIDPDAYDPVLTGNDSSVLVNYGRLTCGSNQWGSGFSNDTDLFGRAWQSDAKFRSSLVGIRSVTAVRNVSGTGVRPNYFPAKLYGSAVTLVGKGILNF